MTIFFGTLLSFTRMQLGPIQKVQVEIDTKKKILGAVMDISSLNPDEILSLYSKKMTSVVLDISGNEISPVGGESIIAEEVNIQKNYKINKSRINVINADTKNSPFANKITRNIDSLM